MAKVTYVSIDDNELEDKADVVVLSVALEVGQSNVGISKSEVEPSHTLTWWEKVSTKQTRRQQHY